MSEILLPNLPFCSRKACCPDGSGSLFHNRASNTYEFGVPGGVSVKFPANSPSRKNEMSAVLLGFILDCERTPYT